MSLILVRYHMENKYKKLCFPAWAKIFEAKESEIHKHLPATVLLDVGAITRV